MSAANANANNIRIFAGFTNPDHLAIPASEVAVERLFNSGTDLLGLRRHSLSPDTMRTLVLLRDM
ncbi:hypothetical protein V1517DRAFT_329445, partial [Lipomyces orientalis]